MPVEYLGELLSELTVSTDGDRHRTVATSSASASGEGSGSGSGTSGRLKGGGGVRERARVDAVLPIARDGRTLAKATMAAHTPRGLRGRPSSYASQIDAQVRAEAA